ncbi:MAG: PAS domain-containing protein [Gammaproteobacteria bacterium]|nr:PAS domain-containing protein [Gammaproteobacteria bacterium]
MDEILFKNLIAIMPGHVYWKDKSGVYLGCNDRQAHSLGFKSPEDIIGKTDFDISPTQEEAQVFWENDQEVMRTGQLKIIEESAMYEGKRSIMLSQKIPLRDEMGEIIGIFGISFDITNRKNKENELKAAKEHLEAIDKSNAQALAHMVQKISGQKIDQEKSPLEYAQMMCDYYENIIAVMPGNVYWMDHERKYLGCNDNCAKYDKLNSRTEIIGKTLYDIFEPLKAQQLDKIDKNIIASNKPKFLEEKTTPGDPDKTFLTHKIPLHDQNGNIIGLLGISFDITERKKQEEALRQAEIREKAQEERIKTMESIGAAIAHELRTPLRAIDAGTSGINNYLPKLIYGYQLAKKAGLPVTTIQSRHIKALNQVCQSVEKETHFANTIIDMFLMNIRPLEIDQEKLEKCSAVACINEAIRRYPFEQNELALIHWDQKNDFEFLGNSLLIVHILFNLFKNALYYISKAGKGEITIWLDRGKKYHQIHFKDTGTGIPAEILPRIFDHFFSKTHGGSGVGLTFCDIVMKSLGGKITCDSKEGEYTEFILMFPAI